MNLRVVIFRDLKAENQYDAARSSNTGTFEQKCLLQERECRQKVVLRGDLIETQFVVDEVSNVIKEAVESTIGGNTYQQAKVNQWASSVVESCLSSLTKLQKPFKYIVSSVIMQKTGAGLHTASSCYWDNSTDGSCTVRWENKTMYCIVSVFGLAI